MSERGSYYLFRCKKCGNVKGRYRNVKICRYCGGELEKQVEDSPILPQPNTGLTHRSTPTTGEEIEITVSTAKVALEAVKMVYQANVAWLQIHKREADYVDAMDELEQLLEAEE